VSSCLSLLPSKQVAIEVFDCSLFSSLPDSPSGQICFWVHQLTAVLFHYSLVSCSLVPPSTIWAAQCCALSPQSQVKFSILFYPCSGSLAQHFTPTLPGKWELCSLSMVASIFFEDGEYYLHTSCTELCHSLQGRWSFVLSWQGCRFSPVELGQVQWGGGWLCSHSTEPRHCRISCAGSSPCRGLSQVLCTNKICFKGWSLNFMCMLCIGSNLFG
jgi:hypothetical protein